jgi:hypothetical protein|tara:strand:- start:303 stop:830 length:528 start_codon:yes stop_codon:yes gene_type:complete
MTNLVGNGSSNRFYDKGNNDYTIVCNVPQHGIKHQGMSIIDGEVLVWMKKHNYHPTVPVYCTSTIKSIAQGKNIGGDWHPVYERKNRYNAGLHAAEYLTRFSETIHLWGFDSLWSTDITSQMDNLIERVRKRPLQDWWRPQWDTMFNSYDCEFVIHLPTGESCEYQQTNVREQHH